MKKIDLNNQVVDYIAASIEFIDNPTDNDRSLDYQLDRIYNTFKREMIYRINDLKRRSSDLSQYEYMMTERPIFIEWLQGHPTDIFIEYRTFEHIELLSKFFKGIDWTLDRDPSDLFYKTVANTFYDLLLIYNID